MHESGTSDFGKHILPSMVKSHKLVAYDFDTDVIPGTAPYEEHGYWRDVGTIDAYYEAHFDTLGATPKFRMTNRQWPIYASAAPAESVQIDRDAVVEHSIVMERSVIGRGAHLRRVIVDQDNVIPPGETIGVDLEHDRRRFHVSEGGIVVVPKGAFKDGSADKQTRATHDATLLG
jgi:glucose-1-phosphate adenylyltransferase